MRCRFQHVISICRSFSITFDGGFSVVVQCNLILSSALASTISPRVDLFLEGLALHGDGGASAFL